MSEPYLSIFTSLGLAILYGISYISARRHLHKRDSMWSIPFVVNFAYFIVLVAYFQPFLFRRLGIDTKLLKISTDIMTIGAIAHHLSIMLHKKRTNSRILHLTHFQISHILISIPFLINFFAISIALFRHSDGYVDISFVVIFLCICIYYAKFLLRAGFDRVKTPHLP
jgi:hypothetical protein